MSKVHFSISQDFSSLLSISQDNQTLAGVVGIDIPVSRFEAFAPRSQLGPLVRKASKLILIFLAFSQGRQG